MTLVGQILRKHEVCNAFQIVYTLKVTLKRDEIKLQNVVLNKEVYHLKTGGLITNWTELRIQGQRRFHDPTYVRICDPGILLSHSEIFNGVYTS